MTLLPVTQMNTFYQLLPVSEESFEVLPGGPRAFCLQFNIYSQQLFLLTKINA